MRQVVVGSFVGFVFAAAFLAACGGGGDAPPPPAQTPASGSAIRWGALGASHLIGTGIPITGGEVWTSTTVYENGSARAQRAAFEIVASVSSTSSVRFDVGILPALNASHFATDPQWVGAVEVAAGPSRRATLFDAVLLPARFRVALRVSGGSANVTNFSMAAYDQSIE
jgi:hypothetical protein